MAEKIEDKQVFSLLEVTRSVQKTIARRYARTYWIKAEMNKLNHYIHSGHAYPDLVEKKDGKIVAEMRGTIWRSTYQRINTEFIKYLGEPLKDGITMIFEASITFHPMYGMGLNISDIDVSYVLGELEKEKKESIAKLKKEGLFHRNKQLPFPLIPKRLAIISVETSKGLSDFYKIIQNNPWGYKIETTLYPALLQGDKSIPSILHQLISIRNDLHEYDVVTIIRGGGGEVGLASYNNYQLAKAIALFPIPVLTGIGHATNETVCEMVAYKNAITPSSLAEIVLQKFHDFANVLRTAEQQIAYQVERQFAVEKQKITYNIHTINWRSQNLIQRKKQYLEHNMLQFIAGSTRLIEEQQRQIKNNKQQITTGSQRLIEDQKQIIANDKKILHLADPVKILQKGFALVWHEGKIITNTSQLKEGDIIRNQLRDGEVESEILKIKADDHRE